MIVLKKVDIFCIVFLYCVLILLMQYLKNIISCETACACKVKKHWVVSTRAKKNLIFCIIFIILNILLFLTALNYVVFMVILYH